MYAGHFAASVAIKGKVPSAPSWALFIGAGVLDYLWSIFIILKWEIWTKTFVLIPWSHSLVMSLFWSILFGSFFYKQGKRVVIAIGLTVFLHFVFDFFVHATHLQIAPGINIMFGLNLGHGGFSKGWFLELLIVLISCGYYLYRASRSKDYGKYASGVCLLIFSLHILEGFLNL